MRKLLITALTAAVTCACSESSRTPAAPTEYTAPLQVQAVQPEATAKNHTTHLAGDQEVFAGSPSPADSHAQGQAHFKVSSDRTSVEYKLIASNINNIVQAHIHCGKPGTNGMIIVWLYPSPTEQQAKPPGAGPQDGILAEKVFRAENVLKADPSDGCPGGVRAGSLDDVIAKIEAGGTYVNVHTNDGVAPPNTGPGDFPGGEIRGQLDK